VILADDFSLQAQSRIDEADALGYQALSFYNHSHIGGYLETVSDRWKRVDLTLIPGIRRDSAGGLRIKSALPGEQCVLMRREVALQYQQFAGDHAELYRVFPDVHDGLLGLFLNKTSALRSSSSFSVRYHGSLPKCPSTKSSSLRSYKA
jgi:hypothetical protein